MTKEKSPETANEEAVASSQEATKKPKPEVPPQNPAPLPAIGEVKFAHVELMQEENIKESDLPDTFKTPLHNFNLQCGRYTAKPTLGTLQATKSLSVNIADKIQTWIEDKNIKTPSDEEAAKKKPADKPKDEIQTLAGSWTPAALEKLKADGRIYSEDLSKLCGKKNLPDIFIFDGKKLRRSFAFYFPIN